MRRTKEEKILQIGEDETRRTDLRRIHDVLVEIRDKIPDLQQPEIKHCIKCGHPSALKSGLCFACSRSVKLATYEANGKLVVEIIKK